MRRFQSLCRAVLPLFLAALVATHALPALAAEAAPANTVRMAERAFTRGTPAPIWATSAGPLPAAMPGTALKKDTVGADAEPVLFMPEKVGIGYVDKLTELVATMAFRNAHSAWRIDRELAALGMEAVVAPASLVTPQGIARSKLTLSKVDDKIDTLMRENDATMKLFVDKIAQIDMPGRDEMLIGVRRGMERHLDWCVRFVENQRAIVDVIRRVVAFADARMGKIKLKDDTLVISDDADLRHYNELVAEMKRELVRYEAVRGEAIKRISDMAGAKVPVK